MTENLIDRLRPWSTWEDSDGAQINPNLICETIRAIERLRAHVNALEDMVLDAMPSAFTHA